MCPWQASSRAVYNLPTRVRQIRHDWENEDNPPMIFAAADMRLKVTLVGGGSRSTSHTVTTVAIGSLLNILANWKCKTTNFGGRLERLVIVSLFVLHVFVIFVVSRVDGASTSPNAIPRERANFDSNRGYQDQRYMPTETEWWAPTIKVRSETILLCLLPSLLLHRVRHRWMGSQLDRCESQQSRVARSNSMSTPQK